MSWKYKEDITQRMPDYERYGGEHGEEYDGEYGW